MWMTWKDVVNVAISDKPILDNELLSTLEDLIEATPKTATKLFFNQLFGGRTREGCVWETYLPFC